LRDTGIAWNKRCTVQAIRTPESDKRNTLKLWGVFMEKTEDRLLIGTADIYKKTYYYNPYFEKLPALIKDEVQEICTAYAQKLHCVFSLKFREDGDVYFETAAEDWDMNYDEIGAKLDIDRLTRQRRDLFGSLRLWYLVFVKGITMEEAHNDLESEDSI